MIKMFGEERAHSSTNENKYREIHYDFHPEQNSQIVLCLNLFSSKCRTIDSTRFTQITLLDD